MRLPDFSVCLQAQAGIMPLKGKCIPRVQRVVLICRKSMFFQKKCLFSIPIRTLCGLCVLQSLWAFYLGILAETPNPFPRERGYITGATAPRPRRGLRPCDPIFINDRGFSTVCYPLRFCGGDFCVIYGLSPADYIPIISFSSAVSFEAYTEYPSSP